ncbi:TRCF domain-containing protein [Cereibacter johrii]|uniref:DEAD/DEAH box helicase n=1 Tax=Cereibacter johrii TaxID=445629 RepID=UPI002B257170|nr:DEAD/DEAH box helicase [Cereibacter johrii]MEA5162627.1 TRCF domain-containing protein [Cereibacter johrii]
MEPPIGLEALRLLDLGLSKAAHLHITSDDTRAEDLVRFLREIAPTLRPDVFPCWDCLPYDGASPTPDAMGRRMALLDAVRARDVRLVIVGPSGLLQRVPPVEAMRRFAVRAGETLDLGALRSFAARAGYVEDDRIDEPGEIAFRAEVVEVFAAGADRPVRIGLQGDLVTGIRRYDPVSLRSLEDVPGIDLLPVTELPESAFAEGPPPRGAEHLLPRAWPSLAALPDHLGQGGISVTPGALAALRRARAQIEEAHRDRESLGEGEALLPDALYLGEEDLAGILAQAETLDLSGWEPVPAFAEDRRPRAALARFARTQMEEGRRVVLLAATARDLRALGRATGAADPAQDWQEARATPEDVPALILSALARGFVDLPGRTAVVTARDVLGSRAAEDAAVSAVSAWQVAPDALAEGDLVVHEDRGLGCLEGLAPLPGAEGREAIRIGYAADQHLLVPVEEAGRIWRYGTGADVTLDRLNGAAWTNRKRKLDEGIAEAARALVAAAKERAARSARVFRPPSDIYERFAGRFPFALSPDQRRAIAEVLDDLAAERPMNRLVLGDVGFGKTEIALRAAAAVALSGAQVALVAPSTVLARQHAETFRRRFEGFGVTVAHLSRLVPSREAKAARDGLRDGSVRIVVGTHALLGKGVAFADLGLLIVDEEQRFGAAHKARLRALGADLHVLTMTATPIPRTLQTALVGLQDLSEIATPPARRRAVRTLSAEDDAAVLRQALLRERRRGGQSFVIVPRIAEIDATEARLRDLLPEARLRVAHGDLPPEELDRAMVDFAAGRGDILLATSIVETGLDVPRANTMIVMHPQLFGLAQLHQLRGRVGRGARQAYCYLMHGPGDDLDEAALRRLGTLQAFDRLGAGAAIAAEDLDQRGAGELFGERQSGHVRLIGLPLYQHLLAQAVRAARGEPPTARHVTLAMDGDGALPADYIPEAGLRLGLYRRLARAADPREVALLADEIEDRFGPPPAAAEGLLVAAEIRALARSLGIERVSAGPSGVALDLSPDAGVERFAEDLPEGVALEGRRLLRQEEADGDAARRALDLLRDLG